MALVQAAIPAPWWTPLTYSHDEVLPEGLRVSVPLGRDRRVAVTLAGDAPEAIDPRRLKAVAGVVDDSPAIPEELWRLVKWFGETWFIGAGFAMKTILPTKFFTDEVLPPLPAITPGEKKFSADDIYCADLARRYEYYREILGKGGASLVLFPEVKLAKAFWDSLPKELRGEGALWPVSAPAQWKLWKSARLGEPRFIVGSPGAAFVPLAGLSAIVMDEENQGGWRTQSHPVFHLRSLLGMRATFAGARFVLGGTMPSSKGFLRAEPQCAEEKNDARLIFVSLKDALASEFEALRETLPISEPLIRETAEARRRGKWALWLLDRKGYAGEILCEECGKTLRCKRCGASMRWEESRRSLRCTACGQREPIPERCPNCGGLLLTGVRPGLEALYERAEGALKHLYKNVLLIQNQDEKMPGADALMREYPGGALVIGTRRILSLCDELDPAVVGWIDADAEARSPEYDAKARAYAMLWESMWRGKGSRERKIVVQSRRPGREWQDALRRGWRVFWRRELKERREWELPPFTPMIKITTPVGTAEKIAPRLEEAAIEYWISEENNEEIWVRTKRFQQLKDILKPFFDIGGTRKGFPTVLLYLD